MGNGLNMSLPPRIRPRFRPPIAWGDIEGDGGIGALTALGFGLALSFSLAQLNRLRPLLRPLLRPRSRPSPAPYPSPSASPLEMGACGAKGEAEGDGTWERDSRVTKKASLEKKLWYFLRMIS